MHRRGYTLLEVIAASALTGSVLASSLALLRDAVALSDRVDQQKLMLILCTSKLEETLNTTAAQFAASDTSGSFAAEGFSHLRYRVICSDQASDGGIANRLMAVRCVVWNDINADGVQGSDESSVTLATKAARLALYQAQAGG